MKSFAEKRVFITGGSSGIGHATATLLAKAGAHVAIGARDRRRLEVALGQLQGVGEPGVQKLAAVSVDVSDVASVRAAREQVLAELGGLDILINNAGVARPGYVDDLDDEVFTHTMQVNYFGVVNTTRAFLPDLRAQGGGHIVNVSSLLGFMGVFGYTAYAASKFAVVGFSECLRQELLKDQIGVSILYPPDTDTPQLAEENRFKPAETKAVAGNVKVMSPERVAQCLLAGISANRLHIVPGAGSRFTHFMYRHFPWMVRRVIDGDVRKTARSLD
ncbi:MAG: SDR family oxidoreductase [Deltaproteobacteria bacterium]|nr:SDR family oxidoreductase [Deltaproteobacteria bacterium]